MCAKRVSRELHDAFENDIELDLSPETLEARLEPPGEARPAPARVEPRRELIERVRPSQMVPDRFQPRPILPVELHRRFFAGEIDCYGTAAEWLQLAEADKGHRDRVAELIAMATSVDDHGQIKPITGAWVTAPDGSYLFEIETGERRFWGACLQVVSRGVETEPTLRVEAVEAPSVERQIVENRHAQLPTAVAQAREVAALLLRRLGHDPDASVEDPYDYFRQALDPPGRRRLPRGVWRKIEPVMRLTPRRMRQILSVLRLPTPLLERADRYNLSDRVLQAVLAGPEETWDELIEAAIEASLTGEEVAAASVRDEPGETARRKGAATRKDHARSALRGLRGLSGAVSRAGKGSRSAVLDEVADEIVVQADAAAVLGLLEEMALLVRTRLEAMEDTRAG